MSDIPVAEQTHIGSNPENFREWSARTDVSGMNMGVSTIHRIVWYREITGCVHSASYTC